MLGYILLKDLIAITNYFHHGGTNSPLAFFSQGIVASEGINIVINNNVVLLSEDEQKPFILEGRTYVPLRVISENLGAAVEWDGVNQQILIRTTFDVYEIPTNPSQNLRIVLNGEVFVIPEDLGKVFITEKQDCCAFKGCGRSPGL